MNEYKNKIKLWECYQGEYPISQRFGAHLYDENGKCVYVTMGLKAHNGIDFALPVGTKLIAVSDGVVSKVIRQRDNYGNHLRLHCEQSGVKFEVLYAHCSKFLIKQGETIRKGQFIAESGDSGFCKGAHLHFGLRVFDERGNFADYNNGYFGSIDPLELFDLSESNAPEKKLEEKKDFKDCEEGVEKYWKWFRDQGYDLSIGAHDKVDARWVATILGKYHESQNNKN